MDDDWGWSFGVWWKPGGVGAPFFGIICAENAAEVGVVFGVAIVFRGEEILFDRGNAGGGGCKEGGKVGCHCGVMPLVGGEGIAMLN